ncbi:hypothetical protein [Brachybacterium sp. YJGR34]|uniref:hypothetical protein n=1 Tax=Brachybacterium sp. YJGR34 TaxID=2059911 RepID=UPI00130049D2|nr:hypothetical protein [Brachybacterium sp. YJGR34]
MRIVGAVLALCAGAPWLLLCLMVVGSRFGGGSFDPHGYVLILGTVLALPLGLLTALGAVLLAPSARRARTTALALAVALLVWAGLATLLVTAP